VAPIAIGATFGLSTRGYPPVMGGRQRPGAHHPQVSPGGSCATAWTASRIQDVHDGGGRPVAGPFKAVGPERPWPCWTPPRPVSTLVRQRRWGLSVPGSTGRLGNPPRPMLSCVCVASCPSGAQGTIRHKAAPPTDPATAAARMSAVSTIATGVPGRPASARLHRRPRWHPARPPRRRGRSRPRPGGASGRARTQPQMNWARRCGIDDHLPMAVPMKCCRPQAQMTVEPAGRSAQWA
jgi:hypothetical protein